MARKGSNRRGMARKRYKRPPVRDRNSTNVRPRRNASYFWDFVFLICAMWLGSKASGFVGGFSGLYDSGWNYNNLGYDRVSREIGEGTRNIPHKMSNNNTTKVSKVLFNRSSFQVNPRYQERWPESLTDGIQGNSTGGNTNRYDFLVGGARCMTTTSHRKGHAWEWAGFTQYSKYHSPSSNGFDIVACLSGNLQFRG
jgi:hypothetical protein